MELRFNGVSPKSYCGEVHDCQWATSSTEPRRKPLLPGCQKLPRWNASRYCVSPTALGPNLNVFGWKMGD